MSRSKLAAMLVAAGVVATSLFSMPEKELTSPLTPTGRGSGCVEPAPLAYKGVEAPQSSRQVTTIATSKAPWASRGDRFKEGDFVWLVANARNAPEAGSYSYALQAVSECVELLWKGSEAEQVRALELSAKPGDPTVRARLRALDQLMAPCRGLGDFGTVRAQQASLSQDLSKVRDARAEVLDEVHSKLRDPSVPRGQRQSRFAQLMGLDDPEIASSLKAIVIADGASYEGVKLAGMDRGAFGLAWDLAVCSNYGECAGSNSRRTQRDCLLHGECRNLDSFQSVQELVPPASVARVYEYHSRIQRDLVSRSYASFGFP